MKLKFPQGVQDNIVIGENVSLDPASCSNLRTEMVRNHSDINAGYALSVNYCYFPVTRKSIRDTLSAGYWAEGSLLTDLYTNPKSRESKREPVGFLLLTEGESLNGAKQLMVTCFAIQPWFPIDVAARWADFRINKARDDHKDFIRTVWLVDDSNFPLQLELRDLGYKSTGYVSIIGDNVRSHSEPEDYRKVVFVK